MSDSTNVADALAAIEAFFDALGAEQWEAAAELVDSRAAASFRELELRSLTGWAQHRDAILAAQRSGVGSVGWSSSGRLDHSLLEQLGTTPLRGLPGIDTLADLVALPQRMFIARCLEIANARFTTPTGERIESRRRILGGVGDGDAIVHVLYRNEGPGIEHSDPLAVDMVRLKRSEGGWLVDLTTFNTDIASIHSVMMLDFNLGDESTGIDPTAPDA